jgi:hypothetical protein
MPLDNGFNKEYNNIMKTTRIIVAILIIGSILSIIAYKKYQEKLYREQLAEERRKAELEFDKNVEMKRKERFSKYKLIEDIGTEYFEKNLTSIDIEKRKKQVINEIPGKVYSLYVRIRNIEIEGRHRVVSFSRTSRLSEYLTPIGTIFYDDNNLLENMKTGTFLDIEAKAIRAVGNGNNVIIYFDIVSVELADRVWDNRISEKERFF